MVENAQWASEKLKKLTALPVAWNVSNHAWVSRNYTRELYAMASLQGYVDGENLRYTIGLSNLATLILMGADASSYSKSHAENAVAQAFKLSIRVADSRPIWDSAVLLQPEAVAAMLDKHEPTHLRGAWTSACKLMTKQLQ